MTLEEAEKILKQHRGFITVYTDGDIHLDGYFFGQEFFIALGLWLEQKPEGWEKIFK